ncbi:MAG TPA: pirin family protein [Streptosporangiaceae bacterium]|nr:pirin family protein [Streptosporangiaceae bacterium]
MSTVDANVENPNALVPAQDLEVTAARLARVGDLTVRRLLPLRLRRSVGPWCFVDHYGPQSVDGVTGMRVPPHPHIGLQTVTWLLAGNVLHRDSLGSEQMIRPGQLNLMTAGRGIAHAEESPAVHDPILHGVQLWVALPDASRLAAPAFEHHAELPATRVGGFRVTVFMGELAGARSDATAFSPIIGAELTAAAAPAQADLPLDPAFEHVLFVAAGSAVVTGRPAPDGVALEPGQLLYVPTGRDRVSLTAPEGSCVLLLGGTPLGETLLMWWNFVARTPEEIAAATASWQAGDYPAVGGYEGDPLPAPPLDVARLLRRARPGDDPR